MKAKSQTELIRSVRKRWGFNPVTRQVPSKKVYKRNKKFKDSI